MKRGKKYTEAAKLVDRATQWLKQLALLRKQQLQNLMKP